MAKYVLDKLLDIRKKREDELTQQLAKARSDLQIAEEQCEEAKRNLDDFVADMPATSSSSSTTCRLGTWL